MQETLQYLKASLDDFILSNSEKKALKSVLSDKQLKKNDLNRLRSEIFKMTREELSDHKSLQLLNWLEQANKLLLPKEESQSNFKSYFSPGNDCQQAICNEISYACRSIDICVFTISDNVIRDKIVYAISKGIKVRIITDDDKTMDMGSDIDYLHKKGAIIKTDNTSYHMHNKFAIFDEATLITGSYNWTRSAAEHNQENIIVTNEQQLIVQFRKEFERLWKHMLPFE
ncbi:phospholipase D-like domain-containing protein [Carboxylicivirga sp. N1Y90]|uniref:phospholipase D-like domain-containing protein n=1 Tax=Carboxylicivirga fragile TaxID=3417571 RepID=UPI003D329E2A|nr:hypothetical protein [Marinilabiliaceae bacterium N1Y90]